MGSIMSILLKIWVKIMHEQCLLAAFSIRQLKILEVFLINLKVEHVCSNSDLCSLFEQCAMDVCSLCT